MDEKDPLVQKTLIDRCSEVLNKNYRGHFTAPAEDLYPHQWMWDSCFVAIGWSHINPEKAVKELESLFKGQWHNGMIPNVIFNMDTRYFADRNFWKSWLSKNSPDNVATSGITQPPIVAEAVWRVGQKLDKAKRLKFYKKMFPKLVKYHNWLYLERDPHDNGLTIQINPYETGLDNAPPWMHQLREHSRPIWIAAIENLKLDRFINVARRDTRRMPAEQRMTNIDALMLWDSVTRLRRKHYDINKIFHRPLFAIEDVGFNSILVRNNQVLANIASEIKFKIPKSLQKNFIKSEEGLEKLWDDTYGIYLSRDFLVNKLIREPTVASLFPLYAGSISPQKAKKLVSILKNDHAFWLKYPVPSVPRNLRYFEQNRYWQGPTWINTNWLLIDGLNRMGFEEEANILRDKTINLVDQSGMWEYFNPLDGKGLGAKNFSWSAALTIDLIKSKS